MNGGRGTRESSSPFFMHTDESKWGSPLTIRLQQLYVICMCLHQHGGIGAFRYYCSIKQIHHPVGI